jgi:hypothetical protein
MRVRQRNELRDLVVREPIRQPLLDARKELFFSHGQPFELDVFPAEHIFIHPVGGGLRGDGASAAPGREETTWGAIKEVFRR